jgi:membrane protein YdbS with pleckstrin-like domain
MMTTIALLLLLLTVTLSLGGGLYEVLVIYPNWKHDVDPHTLRDKLESSGQNNAGRHFWPLVSPAQGLLAIVNIVLAYNYVGPAHCYWLFASIIVFVSRLITFAYFIPVMIRKIMQPEKVEKTKLQAIVKTWTGLGPWRLIPEMAAWVILALALIKL